MAITGGGGNAGGRNGLPLLSNTGWRNVLGECCLGACAEECVLFRGRIAAAVQQGGKDMPFCVPQQGGSELFLCEGMLLYFKQ